MEHVIHLRYQECKDEWETVLGLEQRCKLCPTHTFYSPLLQSSLIVSGRPVHHLFILYLTAARINGIILRAIIFCLTKQASY